MLAAVVSADGELRALHRTYLNSDGSGKAAVDQPKKSLGPIRSYSCHLGEAGEDLAVSEGIETGLSFQLATGIPTWAALNAGNVRNLILPPLPIASFVTIAADADEPGLKAAEDAAARRPERDELGVLDPPAAGQLLDDELRVEEQVDLDGPEVARQLQGAQHPGVLGDVVRLDAEVLGDRRVPGGTVVAGVGPGQVVEGRPGRGRSRIAARRAVGADDEAARWALRPASGCAVALTLARSRQIPEQRVAAGVQRRRVPIAVLNSMIAWVVPGWRRLKKSSNTSAAPAPSSRRPISMSRRTTA